MIDPTQLIRVPKIVRSKQGDFWIPPFPPHWDIWIGEYSSLSEAREERAGMEKCINGVQWRMMLVEMEDEFDEQWERMERKLEKELAEQ